MAYTPDILLITLNGTGTEIPTLDVVDNYTEYWITGTAIATGNYGLNPTGSVTEGLRFVFQYQATLDITTNSKSFSIFGQALTQSQLTSELTIICSYTGSAWIVQVLPSLTEAFVTNSNLTANSVSTSNIQNSAITNPKLASLSVATGNLQDNSITTVKINSLAIIDAKVNDVNGSKIVNASIDGSIKLIDNSVPNSKLSNTTPASVKFANSSGIANDLALGNNQTIVGNGSTVVTKSIDSFLIGSVFLIDTELSFESGLQATISYFMPGVISPQQFTLLSYNINVTKTLAGTDSGTIAIDIAGTPIGNGAISIAASTTINNFFQANIVGPATLSSGQSLNIVPSKATAGGSVHLTLWVQRTT